MVQKSRRLGRKKQDKKRIRLFLGIIVGVIALVVYLLLFAPFLRLQTIEINTTTSELRLDIESLLSEQLDSLRMFGLVAGDRYVFFNGRSFEQTIASSFPAVADVAVSANIGGTISVVVEERSPYGIVCRASPLLAEISSPDALLDEEVNEDEEVDDKDLIDKSSNLEPFRVLEDSVVGSCIYFDDKGIIYEEAPRTRGSLIVGIYIGNEVTFELGQRPLSDSVMQWFLAVIETLKAQSSIEVTRFYVPRIPVGTVYVETSEGWWVAMDAMGDHLQQLRSVVAILEEAITPERRVTLKYIDVRVPGRAFYK